MGLSLTIDVTAQNAMLQNMGGDIPQGLDDALEEVADLGLRLVRGNLDSSLRHPTGRYMSTISAHPDGQHWVVDDGGRLPYGPWLEGVGSRNRTTRFKGYHSFRRAAQDLARQAYLIAERTITDRLRKYMR